MSEIAVITGGTSGIGRATALCLRDAGYDVYELSRREQGVEGLHHIRCDITDEDQVRAAVAEIIGQAGRIDVLINNAGFGISGAVEFTDTAEAQRLLDFFHAEGAVLKERSPSCGKGVIYDGSFSGALTEGDGVFAQLLRERGVPVYGESDIPDLLGKA